jgi:hypothetical protein
MAKTGGRPVRLEHVRDVGAKSTFQSPPSQENGKPPRRNKRRKVGGDKCRYHSLDEVAEITGTSRRTLKRDIVDGLLICTYFRGARRISDGDLQSYLRKCRGSAALMRRRRSPRANSMKKQRRENRNKQGSTRNP